MAGGLSASLSSAAGASIPEIRVVVLGDPHVGKTALLRQYLDHEDPSPSTCHEPTLLDSYTHTEYIGAQPYRLLFTDCCSAPAFCEHRAAYLAKCDLVILVYSAQQRKSLQNLTHWMKEVVGARNSTGPARFASTRGDFREVPIFVVGTHFGENGAAEGTSAVTTEEAESVTTTCLHSAGYFVDDEDADIEEARRLSEAEAEQQRRRKARTTSRVLHGFFHRLFQSNNDGNTSHKKDVSHDHIAPAPPPPPPPPSTRKPSPRNAFPTPTASPKTVSLPVSSPVLQQLTLEELRSTGASSLFSIPPGASARLPLYQLSNFDGAAVDTAMRACISLHVWLQRQDSGEGLPTALVAVEQSPNGSGSAALCSKGGDVLSPCGSPAKAVPVLPLPLPNNHARSLSSTSHVSHVSERSSASFMPPMVALYTGSFSNSLGGHSFESPTLRPSRGVSFFGQLAVTASNSPLTVLRQTRSNDAAHPLSPHVPGTCEAAAGFAGAGAGAGCAAAAVAPAPSAPSEDGGEAARDDVTATPPATASPSNTARAAAPERHFSNPASTKELSETELGSPWSSPACATVPPVPTTATHSFSPQTQCARSTDPATPLELNATATFAGSIHLAELPRADNSVYHSPPHPRRNTVARRSSHRANSDRRELSAPINESPSSTLQDPAVAMSGGGEFSALSTPELHDASCASGGGGGAALASAADDTMPVKSRHWRGVDAAESSAAAVTVEEGSTKVSALVTKKLLLEYDGRSGLTSSPTSQRNNIDDDGLCEDSGLRISTPDTLTSPAPMSGTYNNAPFAGGRSTTPKSAWCSPTTQLPSNAQSMRDVSYVVPIALSPRGSQRMREPITPSHSPTATVMAPRNGRAAAAARPPLAVKQADDRPLPSSKAAPSSPQLSAQQAQKQKTTQCNAGSCSVM